MSNLISVVIPCYNGAATVGATVESALAQDVAVEVIVVNDGSTDGSLSALKSFGKKIGVVTTPNRGASAARDTGTRVAKGEFVQYLDSDDLLVKGTLAARLGALAGGNGDVAHTAWEKAIDRNGELVTLEVVRPDLEAIERDSEAATASSTFWAPPAALLYSRRIVERIGSWHPNLPVIQDARFLFEAARAGARFVHVPEVGARYRVSAGSLSRRSKGRFVSDCALNAQEIEGLWRNNGSLSALRSQALKGMWAHVATSALLEGLDCFEVARQGFNRHGSRRFTFETGRVVRGALGPAAAARLARAVMHGRLNLRRTSLVPAASGIGSRS